MLYRFYVKNTLFSKKIMAENMTLGAGIDPEEAIFNGAYLRIPKNVPILIIKNGTGATIKIGETLYRLKYGVSFYSI